jgi:hypothetical protein
VFTPNREQARRFLIEAWGKRQTGRPTTPIETLAGDIVAFHPEYHRLLESGDAVLDRDWTPTEGETNPFLHLSLHLAIEEQLSIDQPPGIASAFRQLLALHGGDRHRALHVVLDCLGETLWRASRDNAPLDASSYLACLQRAAGRTA